MSISGERGGDDPERKGGSPKFPYSHRYGCWVHAEQA